MQTKKYLTTQLCVYSGNGPSDYNDGNWDNRGRGFTRGAYGRSRGRGYRGRGRGGYGGQPDYQQETGGYAYSDEAPIQNRGRGIASNHLNLSLKSSKMAVFHPMKQLQF